MKSGKLLIVATLALVTALFVGGIYYPDTLAMSFAETGIFYTWLRALIIVLLVSVLLIRPPRSLMLRVILGVWSVILATVSIQEMLFYQLNPLEALVFIEVAIIFAIEALETRTIPVSKKPSSVKRIPVIST